MLLKPNERRWRELGDSVLAALRELHGELRSLVQLLTPPGQQCENSTSSDQPTADQQAQPWPQATIHVVAERTNAEISQHEADRQSNNTFRRKTLRVQWALLFATLLAFGAAAYYAHMASLQKEVMVKQWQTMDGTFKEVQKQVVAAQDANRLTAESIRGRVAITNIRLQKPIAVGEKIIVLVETENVGHSTAFERNGQGASHWSRLPSGPMSVKIPSRDQNTTSEPGSKGLIGLAPISDTTS